MRQGLSLAELGDDLRVTSPRQRWIPLFMPFLWAGSFMVLWTTPYRGLCLVCLLMVFSADSTATHDVVHGAIGLRRRATEWFLYLLGLVILESGHAYRLTHLEHHRIFPDHHDIEGQAAHLPLWRVAISGPIFLPRLWLWAWKKAARIPGQRTWLLIEAPLPAIGLVLGYLFSPAYFAYAVSVILASWLYPTVAVWLPHRHFEPRLERQPWIVNALAVPRMFLSLAFHVEHHWYPSVPSHQLPELARRLQAIRRN